MDRAALDAARQLGTACGGWCPRGHQPRERSEARRFLLRVLPR